MTVKVSVLTITYNHERYITQAVESVLMQDTSFDFELVIGEDCSPDGTRAHVERLALQHPDRIRLLPSERNLGMQPNFIRTFAECRGEYIAILEGDDFWTNPAKLQMQADYLDAHPECSICFHDAISVSQDGKTELRRAARPPQAERSTLTDLLRRNFITNCTVMFRNRLFPSFPGWFANAVIGDWLLHVFNAQYGDIGFLPDVMAAYRVHTGGVYSTQSFVKMMQQTIMVREQMNEHLGYRYDDILRTVIAERWERLERALVEEAVCLGEQDSRIEHMATIFDDWPEGLTLTEARRKDILAAAYLQLLYRNRAAHRVGAARNCLRQLFRLHRLPIHNRGVGSILLWAMANPHRA